MNIADLPRPEPIRPVSAARETVPWTEAKDGDRINPFRYGHHWSAWEFVPAVNKDGTYAEVGEFLPSIQKIVAMPGVNDTPNAKPGQPPVTEPSCSKFEAKGGTIIRLGDDRLGDLANYLCAMPGDNETRLYCDQSERVSILPGGVASWVADHAAWTNFRRKVRDSGIIPALHRASYDRLVKLHDERVERWQGKAVSSPHAQKTLDKMVAIRDQLVRSWAAMQEKAAKNAPKMKPTAVSA